MTTMEELRELDRKYWVAFGKQFGVWGGGWTYDSMAARIRRCLKEGKPYEQNLELPEGAVA